jgi:hypothetical protein
MQVPAHEVSFAHGQSQCPEAKVAILSGNKDVTRNLCMRAERRFPLTIGGVDCRLLKYTVRSHTRTVTERFSGLTSLAGIKLGEGLLIYIFRFCARLGTGNLQGAAYGIYVLGILLAGPTPKDTGAIRPRSTPDATQILA